MSYRGGVVYRLNSDMSAYAEVLARSWQLPCAVASTSNLNWLNSSIPESKVDCKNLLLDNAADAQYWRFSKLIKNSLKPALTGCRQQRLGASPRH
ncbi:hypothetical protein OH492_10130 [Vibrio chagasii]|nr:hypothetical protein [Vibrio chagasii]